MADLEIELKLRLDVGTVARFRRAAWLQRHKTGRARSVRLLSTYFDTAELDLRESRAALRVRKMGSRREQTLKVPGAMSGGLQQRTEFNAYIQSDAPQLDLIEDKKLRALLKKLDRKQGLVPVFATDIRRTIWLVRYGDSLIEIALDVGTIQSGDRSRPISEVELELVEGAPIDVVRAAYALCQSFDLALDRDSKAARGYHLYRNRQAYPQRAKRLKLNPDQSVQDVLGLVLQDTVGQVLVNSPVILGSRDPEGVHQARVAVRRARAGLSIFRSAFEPAVFNEMRDELRWLQQAMGQARDFDVFLSGVLTDMQGYFGDRPGFVALRRAAEAMRDAGYAEAELTLNSGRFSRSLLALDEWALSPSPANSRDTLIEFARSVLQKRLKRVLKTAGKRPQDLPHDDLHPLRLDLKKLRYAVGFFGSLYEKEKVRPYRRALSRLQDCLGGLNDALVQSYLINELEANGHKLSLETKSLLEGWNAGQVERDLGHLEQQWIEFTAMDPFWRV